MPYSLYGQDIYHIYGTITVWLFPMFELFGLLLQAIAIWKHQLFILITGMILTSVFSILEKDISLFTGDILAVFGLWWLLWKK